MGNDTDDHTTNWKVGPDGWLRASYGYEKSAVIAPPRVGRDETATLGMNEGYKRTYQGSHDTVLACMEKADELARSYGWINENAPKP
jgi:hypothetical protein